MKRLVALVAALGCVGVPSAALSYPEFVTLHSCGKPIKPYKFTSQWGLSSFQDDVERYKKCIQDFVQDQKDAIQQHQQAAEDAIDEWNRYVQYELG